MAGLWRECDKTVLGSEGSDGSVGSVVSVHEVLGFGSGFELQPLEPMEPFELPEPTPLAIKLSLVSRRVAIHVPSNQSASG
jgi:hypothetical protein